ncbi:hypothetical protein RA27_09310 [Ruegeria sp. ANG-R]|uniref:VPLPA-CTERM sorting domain-containing protein n=1 Tax=Ruegeria sp. ANG-R TaxID=1577903 RepID=UPI00057D229C|nr:VPLPA-CTERM sorting domain-containing protein [Ruegeria sp. ANG-R]KIC41444.1 hypothetical protein RA27_09310 [Ruegeria sp. ANG-R]
MDSKRTYIAALSTAVLSVAATASSALTVDFNVGRNWTSGSNTYTSSDGSVNVGVDGVRVDRNGTVIDTDNFLTASWSGNQGGIGVYDCRHVRHGYCRHDQHTIDGAGPDEFALIDFGGLNVEVTSVTFAYWDRHDTFAYGTYNDSSIPASAQVYEEELGSGNTNPYTHYFGSGELIGSIIGFGADDWRDNFKLQSITFDIVSAVPLPAGSILLLTGLFGMGVMRRRKRLA